MNSSFQSGTKSAANDTHSGISNTLALINCLKQRNIKEVMFQYFNYNFNEETFKIYIDQQYQKFTDSINEKNEDLSNQP